MNSSNALIQQIHSLKEQHQAIILAHNYQVPEIQDVADFIGDSLELSRKASETDAKLIIFCGVLFMAETAKILSPEKRVILPVINAGCPMADMIKDSQLKKLKEKHPDTPVVCYVNSSAEVKALSDICCTSANALQIVESLAADQVIFVPDQGLGGYVAENSSKKIILFPGYCPTHYHIKPQDLLEAKKRWPETPVIVHPECNKEVRDLSDFIAGTGGMVKLAQNHSSNEFIIGTEEGMIYRLHNLIPNKKFHLLSQKLYCPNMKKTKLEDLHRSLTLQEPEILIPPGILNQARHAMLKMLHID